MAKFLVTGGAGFIGGNFLHIMVNKYPNDEYVCIDALTYAGNYNNIKSKEGYFKDFGISNNAVRLGFTRRKSERH